MIRSVAAVLLLTTACATTAAPGATGAPALKPVAGAALPVSTCTQKPNGEHLPAGVWMSPELAAYKAGQCAASEKTADECQAHLQQLESPGVPWLAIGISLSAGIALGYAVAPKK